MTPDIYLHQGDLPSHIHFPESVAVDTEAMGLNPHRDRLCLVQLSAGDGVCHLVQIQPGHPAPHLCSVLENKDVTKIFHFARFDVGILQHTFGITCRSIFCTKMASKLVRTYTHRHGLKDLLKHLLGIEVSKQEQTSDWGAAVLTPEQLTYAANDVLYLHQLKENLDILLKRESRTELAQACFDFLPARTKLDVLGYDEPDIFCH